MSVPSITVYATLITYRRHTFPTHQHVATAVATVPQPPSIGPANFGLSPVLEEHLPCCSVACCLLRLQSKVEDCSILLFCCLLRLFVRPVVGCVGREGR